VPAGPPQRIQTAIEESEELEPYLKDKFPKSLVTKDFDIHSDEDEFNELAKSYLHNKDLMDKRKRAEAFGDIGGFFDRSTRHIHVRSRTHFGHAVHEAMHKVAHPADAMLKKLNMDPGTFQREMNAGNVCARL
jgi:hypothetical protein